MFLRGSIERLAKHYFSAPEHRADVFRAFEEFFAVSDVEKKGLPDMDAVETGLFNEWFLYDFVLSCGKTPLLHFVAKNPLQISKAEMIFYRTLADQNFYGIFEIRQVDKDIGLELENLQTKETVFVYEKKLTHYMKRGYLFFGRVGRVDDRDELVGADTFSLEGLNEQFKAQWYRAPVRLTSKVTYDFIKFCQGQVS